MESLFFIEFPLKLEELFVVICCVDGFILCTIELIFPEEVKLFGNVCNELAFNEFEEECCWIGTFKFVVLLVPEYKLFWGAIRLVCDELILICPALIDDC